MKMYRREKYLTRLFADFAVITLCYYIIRRFFPVYAENILSVRNIALLGFLLTAWYFAAKFTKLYDTFLTRGLARELVMLFQTLMILTVAVVAAFFFESHDPEYSKLFVMSFSAILVLVLPIEKYLIRWYYGSKMADRKNIPLMIVGAGEMGMEFYNNVVEKGDFGYKLVGFLDDVHKPHLNGKYLGVTAQLGHLLQEYDEVEDVIVALPGREVDKIKTAIRVSELHAKRVRVIPDYHAYAKSASFSFIGSMPLISPHPVLLDDPELRIFKRIVDVVITSIAFIFIFSWLFPLIALLIKLTSKGPVFFKQKRWGVHKLPIICYKFRTMIADSKDVNEKGIYQQAGKNDLRVTKFGKFLRKTSLDELPQFINVLKGSMSIVGPRPHPVPLNLESKDKINDYMLRNMVKPGITGWAQVNGFRGETKNKPAKMQARINHDIWYIENWSFWLDMQIILQTVINIFKGEKNAY